MYPTSSNVLPSRHSEICSLFNVSRDFGTEIVGKQLKAKAQDYLGIFEDKFPTKFLYKLREFSTAELCWTMKAQTAKQAAMYRVKSAIGEIGSVLKKRTYYSAVCSTHIMLQSSRTEQAALHSEYARQLLR